MTTVQANAAAPASSPAATLASAKGKSASADFMALLEDINGQAIAENDSALKLADSKSAISSDAEGAQATATGKASISAGKTILASNAAASTGKGSITIETATGLVSKADPLTDKVATDAAEGSDTTVSASDKSANSKLALLAGEPASAEQVDTAATADGNNKETPVAATKSVDPAKLAAVAAPIFIASDAVPVTTAGQKLPVAAKAAVTANSSQPATSDLALGQAAALTVTATPIVVPLATTPGMRTTTGTDHQLDAQFSAFTSTPATDKEAATASTATADDSGEEDVDGDTEMAKAALPDIAMPASITPSRFSAEITQVLSLAQAGQSRTPKEAAADEAVSSPVASTDNSLSAAGLTLVRQPDGQGLVTSFANVTAPAATPQLVYQAPVDQVSIVMQQAAANQNSSMMIALEPAELGRVEISLKFGKNGTVQADVTADNAQTLNLLKGDQSVLHQALTNAGLNPDSNSLSFNLSDGQAQQQQQNTSGSNSRTAGIENDAGGDGQGASSTIQYTVQPAGNGHINFFA